MFKMHILLTLKMVETKRIIYFHTKSYIKHSMKIIFQSTTQITRRVWTQLKIQHTHKINNKKPSLTPEY